MQTHFELSYPVNITNWDGHKITLVSEDDIKKQLQVLRDVGISWIMVAGLQLEEPRDFDIDQASERIGKLIEEEGFKISSHHCIVTSFGPLDESQDVTREKMRKTIDFCKLLKANTLVIHPGRIEGKHVSVDTIYSGFERELQKHGKDKMLEIVADNYKYMGQLALEADLKLALENLGRFEPMADMEFLPKLIEMVDLPSVGYCLDSGHAHAIGESVTEWIDIMGDKLFTTHFHDNRALLSDYEFETMFFQATKEHDEHMSPGFGTISWMDVINAMRKINYQYPINFEVGGWPVKDPVESYKLAIEWWRTTEDLSAKLLK